MKHWACLVMCVGLLAGGCQMGNRAMTKDTGVIHRGDKLQHFELVRIEQDGSAVFRNADMGDQGKTFPVRMGQPFGLQEEARRGQIREYRFTLLSSDPEKQEATVLGEVEVQE